MVLLRLQVNFCSVKVVRLAQTENELNKPFRPTNCLRFRFRRCTPQLFST